MYIPLRRFSSIEELAPVFEHGGQVTFIPLIIRPCCIVRGGNQPWEIIMRGWKGLNDQKDDLLHEFVHLFHDSCCGYCVDPNETRIFNETETERQTKRLLKHNPRIVDEITRELILHPNCSIVFKSDDARDTPFGDYYYGIIAEVAKEVRNGTSIYGETRQLKVLRLANEIGL